MIGSRALGFSLDLIPGNYLGVRMETVFMPASSSMSDHWSIQLLLARDMYESCPST